MSTTVTEMEMERERERESPLGMSVMPVNEGLPINSHVYFPVEQDEAAEAAAAEVAEAEAAEASSLKAVATFCTESRWTLLKKKVVDNFLPIGFACALLVSLSYPYPGKQLGTYSLEGVYIVQAINNVCVFFISGITLNTTALANAATHWRIVLLGAFIILGLTPLLGFVMVRLPLQPVEFSAGLAIFCAVPTTLGVGVALTTAAGGNNSVALILTVMTNIIGIVTMPYFLQVILSSSKLDTFSPVNVLIKLMFTVLAPSVLGHLLNRCSAKCRAFVARRRVELSMFSTCNLVCIIWQTLSSAAATILRQSAGDIFFIIFLSCLLHIVVLAALFMLTSRRCLSLSIKERVAVTIMGAQKSAPVAVTLISYIVSSPAQQGLLSVPALVGQLCQIFIGSALVAVFRRAIKEEEEEQEREKDREREREKDGGGGGRGVQSGEAR